MRLQYLAGEGLNMYNEKIIYNNMLSGGVKYPRELFSGSEAELSELKRKILLRQGRY